MYYLSADDIQLLIEFSAADKSLGNDREQQTAELTDWIHRLRTEAKGEGIDAFNEYISPPHATPSEWPWSATRVVEVGRPDQGWPIVRATMKAPPALFLIASRKVSLPPLRPGDEVSPVNVDNPQWRSLWKALTEWDVATIRRRITPDGWTKSDPLGGLSMTPKGPKIEPVDEFAVPTTDSGHDGGGIDIDDDDTGTDDGTDDTDDDDGTGSDSGGADDVTTGDTTGGEDGASDASDDPVDVPGPTDDESWSPQKKVAVALGGAGALSIGVFALARWWSGRDS